MQEKRRSHLKPVYAWKIDQKILPPTSSQLSKRKVSKPIKRILHQHENQNAQNQPVRTRPVQTTPPTTTIK